MKWSFAPLVLVLLLASACRETKPLPPGDWLGRCAASAEANKAATEFGPPPTKFVRDGAEVLSPTFEAELERALGQFQLETCHELSVVSVASLDGSTLESYTVNYANRIGLGYRRLNNGVLLLLAPKTRQTRIQIGCGLEDVISDAQVKQIMERDLVPAIHDENLEKGVAVTLTALMELARKKTIDERFRPEGCRRAAREGGK